MTSTAKQIGLLFCISFITLAVTGCDMIENLTGTKKSTNTVTSPASTEKSNTSAAKAPISGSVLARVGDWTLTEEEFNLRLKLLKEGLPGFDEKKPGNKRAVLDELVRQQLLVKDAEAQGIDQKQEIVDAVSDFRRTLLVQELANRLTKDVVANDKEAQDYYNKNKDLFVDPVEWKVREIVTSDEATAKSLLVQVLQGGDFAEIAKTNSKAKTASQGGAVPTFTKPPFEAMGIALATLDVGGVSSVFKGPEGYYIVKVEGKTGGQPKVFFAVKSDLISGLTVRKQQDVILKHLSELEAKTKVEINEELLGDSAVSK